MKTFDCLERPLSQIFFRYGQFIAKHPLPLIFFPLFITIFAISGFITLDSITDAIYLFTPANAQSKTERQIIHDLWPLVNGSYIPGRAVTQSREVQITVTTKNPDANILAEPYAMEAAKLDDMIQNVTVEYQGRIFRYQDLCLQWRHQGCPGNKHVRDISELYQHGIDITYPMFRLGNIHGYIGASLGGVIAGHPQGDNKMLLVSARSWLMVYHLQFYPQNVSFLSGLWEKEFQRQIQNYSSNDVTVTYFHSQTLAEELKRNAESQVPRFVLAFSILLLFSVLCNMSRCRNSWYIDWAVSKPVLAILGVINAGMGIITAIGYLNLCSVPYNDIVGVMPFYFVVFAVGVDNMFLMIAAIRRTNRAMPVFWRMGEAMSDAAISMLITALTDALSFGVGTITGIPAVQIFCIYTGAAIAITFLYQITFFAGLLALSIRWESRGLHCIWLRRTVPEELAAEQTLFTRLFWLGSTSDPRKLKHNLRDTKPVKFFQDWYAPILMQPLIRGLAVVWYGVFILFAVYGCTQLREGLEPINLLVSDSYAIPHYKTLEKYFWHYGANVQIVVNNAPSLGDPEERKRIGAMVHTFANTRHTIGDESVQFWLQEMEDYYTNPRTGLGIEMDNTTDPDRMFYGLAQRFFSAKRGDIWAEDVKWERRPDEGYHRIRAFRFLVGLRDIVSSVEQQDATQVLREVAARYPRYNITTFMPLWLFTDQYALVVANTMQNILNAMAVMVFIALLLIPQPICALWVALAIASIDIGVIGFMTLWSVNLDAISMITIIMSIGFSVDYSAHITYGYVCSTQQAPREKIREALGALGWPLTQGAISTILAVVVLADVPAYMIVTFFKTVFLSISLGLLHGLVFLPVTLALFVRGRCSAI